MRPILALALSLTLALPLAAQEAAGAAPSDPVARWAADPGAVLEAGDLTLDDFLWQARPVVVFADSPFDPAFRQQMDLLAADPAPLIARDVVIITDTDPAAASALRRDLRPRGFALVLIGKDGRVALRKPLPWDVREISHAIDKWPMRLQEIRDGGG